MKHGLRRQKDRPELTARIDERYAELKAGLPADLDPLTRLRLKDLSSLDVLGDDAVRALERLGEGATVTSKGAVRSLAEHVQEVLQTKSRLTTALADSLPEHKHDNELMVEVRIVDPQLPYSGVPTEALFILSAAMRAMPKTDDTNTYLDALAHLLTAGRANLEARAHEARREGTKVLHGPQPRGRNTSTTHIEPADVPQRSFDLPGL